MGRSNGGKTVLFSQLLYGKAPVTYSSMKENVGFYDGKKVRNSEWHVFVVRVLTIFL